MLSEYINGKPVVDWDNLPGETEIAAVSTGTLITLSDGSTALRTKMGKRGYLVGFGHAWDSAGDHYITLRPTANGAPIQGFEKITVQQTTPERAAVDRLPVPIPLEQGTLLQCKADNTHATLAFYATVRWVVYYTDL